MDINGKLIKGGAVVTVVGFTGERKSTLIRNIIAKVRFKNKIVWDMRHEYDEREWTVFRNDFNTFRQAMTQAASSAIVFDEGTANIGMFKDKELMDICTASEHNLNVVFMVFHSLSDIPVSLIRNSHFMVLYNTIDTEDSLSGLKKLFIPLLKLKKPVFVNVRQLVGAEQVK